MARKKQEKKFEVRNLFSVKVSFRREGSGTGRIYPIAVCRNYEHACLVAEALEKVIPSSWDAGYDKERFQTCINVDRMTRRESEEYVELKFEEVSPVF